MSCAPCRSDPLTHSFELIGTMVRDGQPLHVFYTGYKTVKDYFNAQAISDHITGTLDGISGESWIWIMDCKFITARHMTQLSVPLKLIKILRDTYGLRLRNLYLINSGVIINGALVVLLPFTSKEFQANIRKVSGTPLEILNTLTTKYGWSTVEAEPVLRRLMKDYV
jgi:hypothetical protein